MNIIFDIGGTNMRIARTDDEMTFGEPIVIPTPRDFDDGVAALVRHARELAGDDEISAIGGGIAGPLNRAKTSLINSPHLHGWIGKPFVEKLNHTLGVPVYIDNDTAVVGLGEAVVGAGKGEEIVAYITVSTGVGGVRIVNGKVDVCAVGFEPGHQIIDAGGGLRKPDEPLFPGLTLEDYVSGTSVEKRFHKKPYELLDDAFWDHMARLLAYGLNNTIVHWSPDIVVIGGSMMKKIGIPVERVRLYLKGILHIYPSLPKIVKAELADFGGLHGGIALIKSRQRSLP